MSLNISREDRKLWSGISSFSDKTKKLANDCVNELLNCGVPVGNKVCYFILINGVWHMNISVKYLGYLDAGNGDKVFKDLIRSVEADVGHDFGLIVFPNSVGSCPYKDFTVIRDEVVLDGFLDFVKGNAKVRAYNPNRVPLSLNNFCFSSGSGVELKNMMLECGQAQAMAVSLNRSGFGWRTWLPVKDDYTSMKIKSTDNLGNVRYIEVVL